MTALVYEASLLKNSCGFESRHLYLIIMYKCKYCNREIKNKGALIVHEKSCLLNPNRKKCKNRIGNHGKTKGYKGTNQFIKAKQECKQLNVSEETKEKIRKSLLGKHLSDEHKNNIRKGLQHWKDTHKEEFINYSKQKSKCAENFKNYLKQNNINFIEEYCPYPNERLYSLDIAWPDEKIAVEINGSQHYDKNGNLNQYTLDKQIFFEKKGWKIIQIYYKWCYGVIENYKEINSIFDLPIHNKEYVKECFTRKYLKNKEKIDNHLKRLELKQQEYDKRKQIIENLINNSGIDFTKSHWPTEAVKYLENRNELWNKGIFRCIRKYYPEFLQRKDIWKRKGSKY